MRKTIHEKTLLDLAKMFSCQHKVVYGSWSESACEQLCLHLHTTDCGILIMWLVHIRPKWRWRQDVFNKLSKTKNQPFSSANKFKMQIYCKMFCVSILLKLGLAGRDFTRTVLCASHHLIETPSNRNRSFFFFLISFILRKTGMDMELMREKKSILLV